MTSENREAIITLTVDLEDLTWRQLQWFADLGRRQGIDPDEKVMLRWDESDHSIAGFEVYIDPKALAE